MIIRSIYGETPEGAVSVEDRPQQREMRKAFHRSKQVGWGPNREIRKAFRRSKQVGVAETAP